MKKKLLAVAACAAPIAFAHPAFAAEPKFGDPIPVGDGLKLDPIIDARLRFEHVDEPTKDGDAITLRLRLGGELKHESGLSFLAEGEATAGLLKEYNAFPFALASSQRRTQYSTIPDPENIELNRLQVQYRNKNLAVTVGRQRINLDDQRWVGSVGWRQNEQTFDAARIEATYGDFSFDGTYAISQRSIFGIDAGHSSDFAAGTGPRQDYDGDFWFLGAGAKLGPVNVKGFAYLLDYDPSFFWGNSSQTYGARATAKFTLAPKTTLNLMASYARQSDYGKNPANYSADYIAAEGALGYHDFTLTAGYELLGSDPVAGRAVQTPMATLHKFNGWADLFLNTPNAGLEDFYVGGAYKFSFVKELPGLNLAVTWHSYHSDIGSVHYGDELNASLGFKTGRVAWLVKFASYNAKSVGADTVKFWLQAEVAF